MEAKSVSASKTIITELMIPSYANFSGKVHGGTLLSLMDKVAYVCAAKHSGCYCVTVAVEGVEFKQPVEVGELVSLSASVNYVGKSSMVIGIRVESLRPKTGEIKHTNTCYFSMVAKDDEGKPTQVPALILETEEDVRRFAEAKKLKSMRAKISEMLHSEYENYSLEQLKKELENERCVIVN